MAISLAALTVIGSVLKEGIKFNTRSMRKETIAIAVTPAIVGVYSAMSEACVESCTVTEAFFAPSGLQWAALITGIIALVVHLSAKRKESAKE